MGLFDYVVGLKVACPSCGHALTNWQSKDGECLSLTKHFSEVRSFHTKCSKCDEWVDFHRKPDSNITLDDYNMSHYPIEKR